MCRVKRDGPLRAPGAPREPGSTRPDVDRVVAPNPGVTAKQILRELSRLECVDAALVALNRRRGAVRRAPRLESRLRRPAHVVPGERLEPVGLFMAAHMP